MDFPEPECPVRKTKAPFGTWRFTPLEGGPGPRVFLGDVEEFDHGIFGEGNAHLIECFQATRGPSGCQSDDTVSSRAARRMASWAKSGSALPVACDIEGCTVVRRGSDEGQAQGHVHPVPKETLLKAAIPTSW